ncbi:MULTISPECIES: methyltransferase domain-containing protein [unclassified Mycolicibacterium]|uniref:class I SAM-dependent methyltransferase n=1 Tax=unclassified Mycolicibacterium TaxID=2636767 RepID=UPI001F4C1C1E|nr:methyltransferase domain-containing protein [Mycolicibacterium sp. YH-1]UNB51886.1 class I SAM-dependent methyltransferase [Mycolicibacterium sp. YH-1]
MALSDRLAPKVIHTSHAYTRYTNAGTALLERGPATVLDVGAGRQWHFPPSLKKPGMNLIGFDIDIAEMSDNALLDRKVSGDACQGLGVPDQSVDLIMGRAVIEHLHDTESFLIGANAALRENGHLIITFPNKHAPFAVLNRILPRRAAKWLLTHLVPGSSGTLGFEAFYDRASYREFKQGLIDAGFDIEEEYVSYFSSWYYFQFFVPLFIVGLALDSLFYALKRPRFAAYLTFVGRKPARAALS